MTDWSAISMTCREASNLLALFVDGELDPRQMRAVALHGTRCSSCELELRQLERLQQIVSETVNRRLDQLDLQNFWQKIEPRLPVIAGSRWQRIRVWWSEHESQWWLGVPAFAAAAAVALLAFVLYTQMHQPTTQPDTGVPQVASADAPASIDSLDADASSVAVVNDPETHTTILWVSEDNVSSEEPK